MGHVSDIFQEKVLARLPGRRAIGHTRYSTAGSSVVANAQPIVVKTSMGPVGIVHNGNLTNPIEIRERLEQRGLDLPDHQRHRGDPPPDGAQRRGADVVESFMLALEEVRGRLLAAPRSPTTA